jgi:hypothetical protein
MLLCLLKSENIPTAEFGKIKLFKLNIVFQIFKKLYVNLIYEKTRRIRRRHPCQQ